MPKFAEEMIEEASFNKLFEVIFIPPPESTEASNPATP